MKNNNIKWIWNKYDEASNKVSDYVIKSIEAKNSGNIHLATYIDSKVLPTLRKRSYELFCAYENEVQKSNQNKYKNEESKKQI